MVSFGSELVASAASHTPWRRTITQSGTTKLSDARLAESLKASGVPVARRTVAKYREAMQIAASHERVRID